jgi:hypothetical protein
VGAGAITALALAAILGPALVLGQTPDPAALQEGRALTQRFYQGAIDEIASRLSDELADGIGGAAGLGMFREQVLAQLGEELEVVDERVSSVGADRVYHRSARFANFGGTIAVVWVLGAEDRITGFVIRPEEGAPAPAPSRFEDHETRVQLRLPFDGEWTVAWGGRTVEENYHAAHSDQRFAYDLFIVTDGRSYRGDGSRNQDYHCFGRPILAPGAGIVVRAVDGVPDNTPGEFDGTAPPGNHVVIDHGNDEYSFLAHLRNGSVRVSAGDPLEPGDPVGECGNSGRSSEPHLHYHLQNTPEFGRGEGLPAPFRNYLADEAPVSLGEPVRGQRIRPSATGSGTPRGSG